MGLTKRLLYMDTRRGFWSKRSATPLEKQNIFFRCMGGLFATIFPWGGLYATFFFLWGTSFIVWRPFCYFFFMWGAFLLRLPPGVGPFSQCGGLFRLHRGFYVFMVFFLWACPFPPHDFF